MAPRHSIIVPTYNRPRLLRRSLEHILKQDYDHYEVIVVNDGGNDEAAQVVAALGSDKISYHWKDNEQKGIAKNFGFDRASGDYLSSFDDDDIMYPGHLQVATSLARQHADPPVICTHYEICDPDGVPTKAVAPPAGRIGDLLKRRNVLSNNGVFLRRDVASRYRYLENPALTLSSDWLLWIKISSEFPFLYSSVVTHGVCEHQSRGSASATGHQYERNRKIFIDELRNFFHTTAGDPAFIARIDAHYRTYIALFLGLGGMRRESLWYLVSGIRMNPMELFSRRSLVIARNLLKGGHARS